MIPPMPPFKTPTQRLHRFWECTGAQDDAGSRRFLWRGRVFFCHELFSLHAKWESLSFCSFYMRFKCEQCIDLNKLTMRRYYDDNFLILLRLREDERGVAFPKGGSSTPKPKKIHVFLQPFFSFGKAPSGLPSRSRCTTWKIYRSSCIAWRGFRDGELYQRIIYIWCIRAYVGV